jgi:hypothetical protein
MQIENGEITEGSRFIGTAIKELRFGYHPAVKVTIGKNIKWFEQDEPDLLGKKEEE